MNARRIASRSLSLAALLAASSAAAQSAEPSIDVQTFWPAGGPQQGLALRSAEVQPHLNFGFTLLGNYQHRPLVYRSASDPSAVSGAVDHAFTVDFLWAFGLFDRVQIMAGIPMVAAQTGAGIRPISGGGVGDELPLVGLRDARFDVAVQIIKRARRTQASGLGLRADVGVAVPTGDARFQGAATAVLQPILVADYRIAGLTITANLGARVLFEDRVWAGALFPSTLLGSLGFAYRPDALNRLSVSAETQWLAPIVQSQTQSAPCVGAGCAPVAYAYAQGELFVGGRYAVDRGRDVEVTAGVGAPLASAPGVALIRAIVGIAYTPRALDDDDDGVKEADDRCPQAREDRDGFEDSDGCPDLDNDSDGVNDADDECADESAGSRPDPDHRGCPIRDRDGDEVLDVDDQCPDTAVGERADPQRRGCPLPDRDRDGVGDDVDQCVSDPSGDHPDRFSRGCPDRDRDHDGVPNETDACADQAETINGVDDADGCPDAGDESVTLGRGALLFANVVRLAPRARALRPQEIALFTQGAQRLRGMGNELARVTVGVLADPRDREGREAQRLAQMVADVLVNAGVERSRVEVRPLLPQPPAAGAPAPRRPARIAVGEVRITLLRNAAAR